MELNDRLRRARLAAGLTQHDLAARTGIHQPNIAAYESGARVPNEETCRVILTTLGVLPRDLVAQHRDQIVSALAERGVTDAMLFGSVAREEDDEGSDIDLIVTFPDGTSLLDVVGIDEMLEEIIGIDVDLVSARGLRPDKNRSHRQILAEAVPL